MSFRVVYGETMPAWERTFPTMRDAETFARQQKRCGDLIFSIRPVVPGEPPRSLMAAISGSSGSADRAPNIAGAR